MTGQDEFHNEVISQFSTLVTAALVMVSGLAWNAAVQTVFRELFWSTDTMWAQLSYAVIVTVVAVIATRWVVRAEHKVKKRLNGDTGIGKTSMSER